MPPCLPLSSERLERHGLFVIEDGQTIFLWVGRDAVPQLIIDVFNLPNYEALRGGKVKKNFLTSYTCIIRLNGMF
jgi:protein transport protein SEC24